MKTLQLEVESILNELRENASEKNIIGKSRFGIKAENVLGVGAEPVRNIAKRYRKRHELSLELWQTGFHEARMLAVEVSDSKYVTEENAENWLKDVHSWDLCDQLCLKLFWKLPFAYEKVEEWSRREAEFEKRAAFALMAGIAVHDKKAVDFKLLPFLPIIENAVTDERNFVKKAVNWALRQIGKRSKFLHIQALETAYKIREKDSKPAKWIAADAIRELESEAVINRLKK